jgi:hypothetical protein
MCPTEYNHFAHLRLLKEADPTSSSSSSIPVAEHGASVKRFVSLQLGPVKIAKVSHWTKGRKQNEFPKRRVL